MTTVPKTDLNLSELKTIGCQQYVSENWACMIQHSDKHKKIIIHITRFIMF